MCILVAIEVAVVKENLGSGEGIFATRRGVVDGFVMKQLLAIVYCVMCCSTM